ncbi:MAG: MotA/TolQ/ExbB proton channel family protein [Planctomycetaceae bacterium]|nr:MotA/TolQ/ExbB proton channel family protein [Planctomycetaceae bacterium]
MLNQFSKNKRVSARRSLFVLLSTLICLSVPVLAWAQEGGGEESVSAPKVDLRELAFAGGYVGMIIAGMSVILIALIIEHMLTIRRGALMPSGLAQQVHGMIAQKQFKQAEEVCRQNPSLLGEILQAGLSEVGIDYAAIEKGMEDSSIQQSSRLLRKIEYLSVIGSIAPMLGLLGTVWGMILAFLEFESKANPQVSELAPGIYKALVTTLMGLSVAVPAVASFAIFRNRVDGLVAEASLLAEHVFADYKRALVSSRRGQKTSRPAANPGIPPVVPERESR